MYIYINIYYMLLYIIYISTLYPLTWKCQIRIYSKRYFFNIKPVIFWFVQLPFFAFFLIRLRQENKKYVKYVLHFKKQDSMRILNLTTPVLNLDGHAYKHCSFKCQIAEAGLFFFYSKYNSSSYFCFKLSVAARFEEWRRKL